VLKMVGVAGRAGAFEAIAPLALLAAEVELRETCVPSLPVGW
jgi:hypothetical protein